MTSTTGTPTMRAVPLLLRRLPALTAALLALGLVACGPAAGPAAVDGAPAGVFEVR